MKAYDPEFSNPHRVFTVIGAAMLTLLMISLSGCALLGGPVITAEVSEPLGEINSANIDIYTGSGNLTVDGQADAGTLANGSLQYQERLGAPVKSLDVNGGNAALSLSWGEGAACTGALEWLIHINPAVAVDLVASSGGGNIGLDLTGMSLASVFTETGGGNVQISLPDGITTLSLTAKSGAGNVVITIPQGVSVRIHASTGAGKLVIDPRFSRIGEGIYQSADYETAASHADLTLSSGAGNIEVISH